MNLRTLLFAAAALIFALIIVSIYAHFIDAYETAAANAFAAVHPNTIHVSNLDGVRALMRMIAYAFTCCLVPAGCAMLSSNSSSASLVDSSSQPARKIRPKQLIGMVVILLGIVIVPIEELLAWYVNTQNLMSMTGAPEQCCNASVADNWRGLG